MLVLETLKLSISTNIKRDNEILISFTFTNIYVRCYCKFHEHFLGCIRFIFFKNHENFEKIR